MQDRVPSPGKEGRIKLTFDDGSVKYARLEMADEPTQPGTPLNKSTLLTDATAAAIGSGISTVDGALAGLKKLIDTASSSINEKAKVYLNSYIPSTYVSQKTLSFPFTPKLVVVTMDFDNGATVILFNGQTKSTTHGLAGTSPINNGGLDVSWNGNTVTLSAKSGNTLYFGLAGYTNYYFAIG